MVKFKVGSSKGDRVQVGVRVRVRVWQDVKVKVRVKVGVWVVALSQQEKRGVEKCGTRTVYLNLQSPGLQTLASRIGGATFNPIFSMIKIRGSGLMMRLPDFII